MGDLIYELDHYFFLNAQISRRAQAASPDELPEAGLVGVRVKGALFQFQIPARQGAVS
jgi:hypothetical protein